MNIGKYKLSILNTGSFALDGGAMFGIIPKPLWERSIKADQRNRIILGTNVLLLESDNRKILVDTGMGQTWTDKLCEIYDINQTDENLLSSLNKNSINVDEISDVILTHLHFDHTGGSTKFENGKWIPAFPNATYHVSKKQFDWAMNPSEKDKGSFIKERFVPLAEEGVMKFSEPGNFLDDEIQLVEVNGHTIGQQLVKINDSSNTVLLAGDLIPTSAHIPLPYVMGYDIQPLITIEEKSYILNKALEEDWTVIFEHDVNIKSSKIEKTEKGFKRGSIVEI